MAGDWSTVSFKKYVSDKRKITRKKHSLESDLYPAEGHRSCHIKHNNYNYIYCIGGSRHEAESLWELSKDIVVYKFYSSNDEMWLEDTTILKGDSMQGSKFQALTYPAVVGYIEDGITTLFVHGGLSVSTFQPTAELYVIKHGLDKKGAATCRVYLPSKSTSPMMTQANCISGIPP